MQNGKAKSLAIELDLINWFSLFFYVIVVVVDNLHALNVKSVDILHNNLIFKNLLVQL